MQVSAASGYHGTALMRYYLGVGAEECTIRATSFTSPLMDGITRYGAASGMKGARMLYVSWFVNEERLSGPAD